MKHEEDSLMTPPLEKLLLKIPQKYELVLAATRRAKQIIRELRINPQAIDESRRGRKPLSIALLDIVEGRVDAKSLVAPDIEFDEYEEEAAELFPELESFARRPGEAPAGEEGLDAEGEEEDVEDTDELDEELDDLDFGLQTEDPEEPESV
jgi:DNA-directed RNA polymerase omega subunit